MINKEIILGNGNIVKDFSDRSIPQNSHNQVCVSFLIPSNQFNDYDDYSVLTAVSRKVGNSTTPLNALVLTASKSITIEGINYIKFSCVLSIDYTNVLGELYFSPYIQATLHTDSVEDDPETEDEDVEVKVLLNQQSYTNCKLNVIKAIAIQEDASLEDLTVASTLASQINSKKIYYNATWNSLTDASENMLYYNIATSYNPSAALYNGSIVAIKNQNVVSFYFPYLNSSNVELFKMTNEGVFYKISGISRTGEGTTQSPYVYNATKQKLTYTKIDVDGIESGLQNQIDGKVDKTQKVNGHALSGDITLVKKDVGLEHVVDYGVETSQPTASGDQLYITSKAVYDYCQLIYSALNGYATTSDLSAINTRLESVEAIIGSDDGDADSVINTLKEVIVVLNGLGEGANLLDLINAKANQSDLTALNNQINGEDGIKDKVDFISERTNAYMEIKNSLGGTIDIEVEDWEANTGDTEYPYKWTLTNGYLEGAVNCIVVYSKDSDTSMLSATVGIDKENGKLIIYASELPTQTISIEKIAVFNDLNAYINYSNEIVQQVNSNTSAISDINNTKLPTYLKKQYQYTKDAKVTTHEVATSQPNSSNISTLKIKNDQTFEVSGGGNFSNKVDLTLKTDTIQLLWRNGTDASNFKNHELNIDTDGFELKYYDKTSGVANTHSLTFDANGDLKVDGNAVGGGGGIPTIEINSAQIIDDYNFTFTQEQGQILFEYPPIINLVLDGYAIPLIYSYDETNKFVYSSVVFSNFDNVKSLYCQLITFNTSTLRGSIVDETFEKPKQLYQHNINIQLWNTDYGWIGLKIIDSDNSSFTYAKLKQWLEDNGFSRVGHSSAMRDKGFSVVGYELDSSKKPIYNIYVDTNENSIGYNAQGTYGSFNSESVTNINDTIIAL